MDTSKMDAWQGHIRELLAQHMELHARGRSMGSRFSNPVPAEISQRIRMNADHVGTAPEALRPQILAVLHDYRDHAWTFGTLKTESARAEIAEALMRTAPAMP